MSLISKYFLYLGFLMIFTTGIVIISVLIFLLMIAGIFSGVHTFTRYVAIGFDMFWNVLTGGQIGVTISSRSGMAADQGKKWGKFMAWWLGKLEPDHCNLAIQSDIDRANAVVSLLKPYDKRTQQKA